jgi:peroxiredoxin (alkyl hydroperoxide reductase subunit C)
MTDGLAPLPPGTVAPDFTLRDQNNEQVTLSKFRGDKAVLLVFYPFAFTGICTGELLRINAGLADFANDAVQVLTVSCDSPYAQKTFAMRDDLRFPLLSDFWPHGAVAQSFGVFNDAVGVANRGTFLIDTDGVIRFSECNEIGVGRDASVWLDQIAEVTSAAAV